MLLKRKASKLRASLSAEKGTSVQKLKTIYEEGQPEQTWREFLVRSLVRPFVLFVEEPIIQLFGVYMAFVYGVIYSMQSIPSSLIACRTLILWVTYSCFDYHTGDLHYSVRRAYRNRRLALYLARQSLYSHPLYGTRSLLRCISGNRPDGSRSNQLYFDRSFISKNDRKEWWRWHSRVPTR